MPSSWKKAVTTMRTSTRRGSACCIITQNSWTSTSRRTSTTRSQWSGKRTWPKEARAQSCGHSLARQSRKSFRDPQTTCKAILKAPPSATTDACPSTSLRRGTSSCRSSTPGTLEWPSLFSSSSAPACPTCQSMQRRCATEELATRLAWSHLCGCE